MFGCGIKYFRLNTTNVFRTVFCQNIITLTQIIRFALDIFTLENSRLIVSNHKLPVFFRNIQLRIFVTGRFLFLFTIHKSPILILFIRMAIHRKIINTIFYITFHNKFATKVYRHVILIQIKF